MLKTYWSEINITTVPTPALKIIIYTGYLLSIKEFFGDTN